MAPQNAPSPDEISVAFCSPAKLNGKPSSWQKVKVLTSLDKTHHSPAKGLKLPPPKTLLVPRQMRFAKAPNCQNPASSSPTSRWPRTPRPARSSSPRPGRRSSAPGAAPGARRRPADRGLRGFRGGRGGLGLGVGGWGGGWPKNVERLGVLVVQRVAAQKKTPSQQLRGYWG